ncbi:MULTISPECIES: hypothetical protein [Pseudomonas]|uniref:hypothetical protein n=1 Tax=Pseudomonas TaxID=286 RepID=UPI0012DE744A|nr:MULTISPECIES: hypothetical protein [Pseudomonas]MCE1009803.1 hypothetical protein [Pseudomonas monteilii]
MDQITHLDDSNERLARIADELEQQVAPCPASQLHHQVGQQPHLPTPAITIEKAPIRGI